MVAARLMVAVWPLTVRTTGCAEILVARMGWSKERTMVPVVDARLMAAPQGGQARRTHPTRMVTVAQSPLRSPCADTKPLFRGEPLSIRVSQLWGTGVPTHWGTGPDVAGPGCLSAQG